MDTDHFRGDQQFRYHAFAYLVISVGIILGVVLIVLSSGEAGSMKSRLLESLGTGIMSTAFISLLLELIWSHQQSESVKERLQPVYQELRKVTASLKDVASNLENVECKLETFKQLGLISGYASRGRALEKFLMYTQEIVEDTKEGRPPSDRINIVSSSSRGLIGYIDREPSLTQKDWRDIITNHPTHFRILLTHPAFAHLRHPAEDRGEGEIELEILKAAIYLHCVAKMRVDQLRLYRGSPTVFAIQAGEHILINPYPYGKMAMDNLCLEFERGNENSYIANFMNMHFNHMWAFKDLDGKRVDGKPLVEGVDAFGDILKAFAECTFLNDAGRLRLTVDQVTELDTFTSKTLPHLFGAIHNRPATDHPFSECVEQHKLNCKDSSSPALS